MDGGSRGPGEKKRSLAGTYIIDGYNLLRRAFHFREDQGLSLAREKLEVRLREFRRAAGPGTRIVLVYDGVAAIEGAVLPSRSDPAFRVIFSLPPMTADEAVLEESRRLSLEGAVTVVTSDRKDIGRRLRGHQVRHLSSEEFAEVLDAAMRLPSATDARTEAEEPAPEDAGGSEGIEKPAADSLSPREVDEWLRIFSRPKPGGKPGGGKPGAKPGGPKS